MRKESGSRVAVSRRDVRFCATQRSDCRNTSATRSDSHPAQAARVVVGTGSGLNVPTAHASAPITNR